MKRLTALFFLLSFSLITAQDLSKPQYYFDVKGKSILKVDYLKKVKDPKYIYIPKIIENDTAIVGTLYWKEEIGVMSQNDRLEVIKNIEALTGKTVNENQTIVIDFFCIPTPRESYKNFFNGYVNDGAYNKFFKKMKRNLFTSLFRKRGILPISFMKTKRGFLKVCF